jgi:hypothetical protein
MILRPLTTDWLDLTSPVPSASTHAAGLHAYTHDLALGPSLASPNTTVGNDADGLYIATGAVSKARVIDRRLGCSSLLDPVVSFVFRFGAHLYLGVDDESAPDSNYNEYLSAMGGAAIDPTAIYACARTQGATAAAYGMVVGSWYRVDTTSFPSTTVELHLLPSGDPADWDTVNLVKSVSRPQTLGGSDLIYPVWSCTPASTDRVRAIKVAPRRV